MDTLAAALPLRGMIVMPGAVRAVSVGRESSLKAVKHHLSSGTPLVGVIQVDPDVEDPMSAEIAPVGILCQITRAIHMPDGSMQTLLEGIQRVSVEPSISSADGMTTIRFQDLAAADQDADESLALAHEVTELYGRLLTESGMGEPERSLLLPDRNVPNRVGDQLAGQLDMSWPERVALFSCIPNRERLLLIAHHLGVALLRNSLHSEVAAKVQAAMDQGQREYHLREQLKVIRQELGDTAGLDEEADAFAKRIEEAGMPEEVKAEALREVERLRRIHVDGAEYSILRTWLEAICDLPWQVATADTTSLARAQRVLDEDHYGLESVKERILEYLAVRKLKPDSKGPILCFAGPPGVGKTSLGRSIAKALGRNFGRIALGGVKDETEIRGHRRTYIGALPGRITRALIRAGTKNPVLVLDELDKVGSDSRGDPASALLEVLDPSQNNGFVDHYLDVPVDLSQVLFIGTANVIDNIPHALLDRLEIIHIPGYTEEDKAAIARQFLLPRLGEDHGLTGKHVSFTNAALQHVIRDYTREAGVRELNRQLAKIHRKVARKIVEGHPRGVRLTEAGLQRYLGPPKHYLELAERADQPGVVTGLAWTPTGGDILFVEATRMEGKAGLKLTGSLGDVMKESAEAAMSWLRTNAHDYGVERSAFDMLYHLHVPAGAIPKDGPSAGVTMVTALASIATGRSVRAGVAMTGEITLRGKVLPVGGIKEKVLAARRAGVSQILIPHRNINDLIDVPEVLRRDLTFHYVESVQQVLSLALVPTAGAPQQGQH